MSEYLDEALAEYSNTVVSKQCNNSGMVTILHLPNEVLDHIFSFLSIRERIRTEWVCRNWLESGKNYKWSWPKKLNSDMMVDCVGRDDDDIWSSVLSRCGSSLKDVEIYINSRHNGPTWSTCHVIGVKCPHLANISFIIGRGAEDSEAFLSVTRGCPKLKTISIEMNENATEESEDSGNVCLALKVCKSLEYLELTTCKTVIEEGCLDAIKVPLKGFKLEPNDGTNFALVAEKLLRRKDPIEKFEMYKLVDNLDWPMKVFHIYENTLRELILSYCNMSSSNWCKILAPLKHLEVLSLKLSSLIDDELMCVLADNCKKLRMLSISCTAVTDVGVSYLTPLPKLTDLDLNENGNITGEGILSLATCGRLEKLQFANIGDLWYQDNIIEQACIALATNCPNLHLLDLRHNMNITNKLVDEFRFSLQCGLLKGPLSLHVSRHLVDQNIESCENLNLFLYL